MHMRGQLQEGNIHAGVVCEIASFVSFYRAYFMCNLTEIIAFFLDILLHSRLTDSHQVKDKRVAHIVTAQFLNISQFAHEISSVEAHKGGKFTDNSCMDISFLQLPSHIQKNKFKVYIIFNSSHITSAAYNNKSQNAGPYQAFLHINIKM